MVQWSQVQLVGLYGDIADCAVPDHHIHASTLARRIHRYASLEKRMLWVRRCNGSTPMSSVPVTAQSHRSAGSMSCSSNGTTRNAFSTFQLVGRVCYTACDSSNRGGTAPGLDIRQDTKIAKSHQANVPHLLNRCSSSRATSDSRLPHLMSERANTHQIDADVFAEDVSH
jgi:hypothetical protein